VNQTAKKSIVEKVHFLFWQRPFCYIQLIESRDMARNKEGKQLKF
jgi:hypothetical protein